MTDLDTFDDLDDIDDEPETGDGGDAEARAEAEADAAAAQVMIEMDPVAFADLVAAAKGETEDIDLLEPEAREARDKSAREIGMEFIREFRELEAQDEAERVHAAALIREAGEPPEDAPGFDDLDADTILALAELSKSGDRAGAKRLARTSGNPWLSNLI